MPGAGMASRIPAEDPPRCQKALEELRQSMGVLHDQIGRAEERFSAVLAVVPLDKKGLQEKITPGTRPPTMLADEIFEAANVVRHAGDRVRSLSDRCEI